MIAYLPLTHHRHHQSHLPRRVNDSAVLLVVLHSSIFCIIGDGCFLLIVGRRLIAIIFNVIWEVIEKKNTTIK